MMPNASPAIRRATELLTGFPTMVSLSGKLLVRFGASGLAAAVAIAAVALSAVVCPRPSPRPPASADSPVDLAESRAPEVAPPPNAVETSHDEKKNEEESEAELVTLADGLRIDRARRRVEVDATVCLRSGALELLVTTPYGKPHEAIFTLKPKPSQLHAALLLLGYENGAPGRYGAFEATGDRVRLDVIHEEDSRRIVVPVNELVVNMETDDNLPDNVFVFAGSLLTRTREDKRVVYAADLAGDVVSLASFPDEVLALPDPASSDNSRLMWGVDGSLLPGVGSDVVLRMGPAE